MEVRTVVGPLPPADREAVGALAARAAAADGVAPLDEAALLSLLSPTPASEDVRGTPLTSSDVGPLHLLASEDVRGTAATSSDAAAGGGGAGAAASAAVVGYLFLDRGGDVPTAQLVVDPAARRRGVGRALVEAAAREAGGRLEAWAHGDLPAARALAAATGFAPVHELWRMSLDLRTRPAVTAGFPRGVAVRPFAPGHDEAAWLAVNARAFAGHPEQGRWTAGDLAAREREPWFDPAGFLLAERAERGAGGDGPGGTTGDDGGLAGFVWTKVHPAGDLAPEPVGEVYVLGVDPTAQGLGLGRALTVAGLDLLAARGLATAVLWVAGDNAAAIATYRRAGFRRAALDVRYALDAPRSPAGAFMGS